jgi:hypothetical protein
MSSPQEIKNELQKEYNDQDTQTLRILHKHIVSNNTLALTMEKQLSGLLPTGRKIKEQERPMMSKEIRGMKRDNLRMLKLYFHSIIDEEKMGENESIDLLIKTQLILMNCLNLVNGEKEEAKRTEA